MHSFHRCKMLPYTAESVNDVILDIEKYPEFLPWCSRAQILTKQDDEIIAELSINFKAFSETYKSHIITTQTDGNFRINIEAIEGPFKKLTNLWQINHLKNGCEVDFFIDFAFNSILLNSFASMFLPKAANKIISAFEGRIGSLLQV